MPMRGIGRALDDTFEGHWWGIGGHWRALVDKSHMSAHTAANNADNGKQNKTYEKHRELIYTLHERSLRIKRENPGDLNTL